MFHCPCIYFDLLISSAVRSAVVQASCLMFPHVPTAGSGNCNVTVAPETMQATCKGSRDKYLLIVRSDCMCYVDTPSWCEGCVIVVVVAPKAVFAQYFSLASASASMR
jgi:hypothetical protein